MTGSTKLRKRRERQIPDSAFINLPKLAFSIRETAYMLAASASTVRQWAHEGKIRVIWKGSGGARKHFCVPRQSIDMFLERALAK
jgi:excisionase family DNA binding protein